MTPEQAKEREIAEAKERIKALGLDWIAEGRDIWAFIDAIKEIEENRKLWPELEQGAREMSDWHPIETAPKDVAILVFYDNGNARLIEADDNDYSWRPYTGPDPYLLKPTHWMPLPPPPAQEQQQ